MAKIGDGPLNLEQSQAALSWFLDHWSKFGFGPGLVFEKDGDQAIGICGFKQLKLCGELVYDLGFMFQKPHWGKGYATEISRTLLSDGFSTLGFSEVHAHTEKMNLASKKVLSKVGMRYVKNFERNAKDHELWVITASEFVNPDFPR
ncbi:MAG: GNAT family N-acetyltransferase [Bdellovibrionota bacterium]